MNMNAGVGRGGASGRAAQVNQCLPAHTCQRLPKRLARSVRRRYPPVPLRRLRRPTGFSATAGRTCQFVPAVSMQLRSRISAWRA